MASNTEFPTLFKKNQNGSTQEWTTWVEGNVVRSRYGQVGGAMQETSDLVTEGKNAGKKNATTPEEQAVAEARSAWEKKLKSGYHQEKKAAEAGKVDANYIQGGVEPMLAQKYRDHAAKISFPALAQPKFDGTRCIAVIQNGKCVLWSRTRKQITGVPHIVIHLERLFPGQTVILDGELYNHDYHNRFEDLISFIRQQKAKPGHEVVQYHVYDVVTFGKTNAERVDWLAANIPANHGTIKRVETVNVADHDDLMEYFNECRKKGYEGCMVRNVAGTYQQKRSYNLQKVKEMSDDDFDIVGVEEGRGKMAGKAIFVCKTKKGETFTVKMEGALDDLAKYLNNKSLWAGKKLMVRYQGFTNGDVPRFPVGIRVRDSIDF